MTKKVQPTNMWKTTAISGALMLAFSGNVFAASAGTDLNLTAHPAAGGMGGAAYTMPQEASAAVFGNPATLTQFKGVNFNFGATYLGITNVTNSQEAVTNAGTFANESTSSADSYILPTFGAALEIMPGLVLGLGLEADAGLGADYRDDPITLVGGAGGALFGDPIALPLVVELISLNANIGAAFQVTPQLSVGGAVTIGFGMAQLGTTGPTSSITAFGNSVGFGPTPYFKDFGGTTATVHDIAIGASLGATFEAMPGLMFSGAVKSPTKYNFENITYDSNVGGPGVGGWQDVSIEQPLELILGVAADNILMPNLLLEADVVWKNWSNASLYEDVYDDQFVLNLGAQLSDALLPGLKLRIGYSYAEDLLLDTPNNTLSGLTGLGGVPLGSTADGLGAVPSALATDVIKVVQRTLVPVIWEHTVTAGLGYNFTPAVSLNAFGAIAFGEDNSSTLPTVDTLVGVASGGAVTSATTTNVNNETEWFFGLGLNVALP